jgi:hypothetical protein
MSIHVPFSKLFQSKAKGRAWGNCHIGQSAVREELTDSAWVMSHELQEKILETEAAADDLKMLRPLETPKGNPELQEEETAIRLQLARAEKALAPKQREVAEALLG